MRTSRDSRRFAVAMTIAPLLLVACGNELSTTRELLALAAGDHACEVSEVSLAGLDSDAEAVTAEELNQGAWVRACGYLRYYAVPEAHRDTAADGQLVDMTQSLSSEDVPEQLRKDWVVSVHKDVDFSALTCPHSRCAAFRAGLHDDANACDWMSEHPPLEI
jgi:hypothetical protein